jgi:hypothetical protein
MMGIAGCVAASASPGKNASVHCPSDTHFIGFGKGLGKTGKEFAGDCAHMRLLANVPGIQMRRSAIVSESQKRDGF